MMQRSSGEQAGASVGIRPAYAWYVVVLLMFCSTLSFVDRQILSLLVTPIKHALLLSDTRIGLLQGFAFAVFYTILGLPLARFADAGNRRNLIAAAIFFWSIMTALCGAVRGFWSLFMARVGVGIGEAGLSPAAVSLISDYFPPESLSMALSVYSMGVAIGTGLALVVGGTVIDVVLKLHAPHLPLLGSVEPWRMVFAIVGLPGLLCLLWVFTLREPLRRNLLRTTGGQVARLSLREISGQLGQRWRSITGLSVAMACQSIGSYAFFAWSPTLFQRVHGWSPGQAGRALGALTLIFVCSGMFLGGVASDKLQRKGIPEGPLRIAAVSAAGAGLLLSLAMITTHLSWSLLLIGPGLFFLGLPIGTSYAAVQLIFPNQMRAQVIALFLFVVNIGGLTLGALLPGLFEDYVFRTESLIGPSLALTIAISSVGMLTAALATCGSYRYHFRAMHSYPQVQAETNQV